MNLATRQGPDTRGKKYFNRLEKNPEKLWQTKKANFSLLLHWVGVKERLVLQSPSSRHL